MILAKMENSEKFTICGVKDLLSDDVNFNSNGKMY